MGGLFSFMLHRLFIIVDVLVGVVGGVAGVDARHTLHNVIDAPLQLGGGLAAGEGGL